MARIIVCGGRRYADFDRVREVLLFYGSEELIIVHGGARGADALAHNVATSAGFITEVHLADWQKYGKRAGPVRNNEMAKLGADLCIAFPGGAGTAHMVRVAEASGIPVRKVDW